MPNSTNYTDYANITKADAWKESGAMVYVALTVTVMSSFIMCCVWFLKQRVYKSGYGTVVTEEDRVELTAPRFSDSSKDADDDIELEEEQVESGYTDKGFEEDICETEGIAVAQPAVAQPGENSAAVDVASAFVLENGDSSSEEDIPLHAEQVEAV